MERCFLCHRKMNKETGLCTNKNASGASHWKRKKSLKIRRRIINNEYGRYKSRSTGENCPD